MPLSLRQTGNLFEMIFNWKVSTPCSMISSIGSKWRINVSFLWMIFFFIIQSVSHHNACDCWMVVPAYLIWTPIVYATSQVKHAKVGCFSNHLWSPARLFTLHPVCRNHTIRCPSHWSVNLHVANVAQGLNNKVCPVTGEWFVVNFRGKERE